MRTNQVDLKFANLVPRDAYVAQLAHAGSDGVRRAIFRDQPIDYGACPLDSFTRVGSEQNGAASHRHFPHLFECEVVAADVKSVQESVQFMAPAVTGRPISPQL